MDQSYCRIHRTLLKCFRDESYPQEFTVQGKRQNAFGHIQADSDYTFLLELLPIRHATCVRSVTQLPDRIVSVATFLVTKCSASKIEPDRSCNADFELIFSTTVWNDLPIVDSAHKRLS